jgi:hypothetical protein
MPTIYSVLTSVFPNFFSAPCICEPDNVFVPRVKLFVDACKRLDAEHKLIQERLAQMPWMQEDEIVKPMLSLEDAQFGIELLEKPYIYHPNVHVLVRLELPKFYENTLCKVKFDLDEFRSFLVFYRRNNRFPTRRSFAAMSTYELKCVFFREKMCMWATAEELSKNFDDYLERDSFQASHISAQVQQEMQMRMQMIAHQIKSDMESEIHQDLKSEETQARIQAQIRFQIQMHAHMQEQMNLRIGRIRLPYTDSQVRHSESKVPSDLHSKIQLQPNSPCYDTIYACSNPIADEDSLQSPTAMPCEFVEYNLAEGGHTGAGDSSLFDDWVEFM